MRHSELKKISSKRDWIRLGVKLILLAVIFWIILGVLFGVKRIEGLAMSPRLSDGDLSLFYRSNEELATGDVVLFSKNGKQFISRIVAVEGDVISLDEYGRMSVNGQQLSDSSAYDMSPGATIEMSYPIRIQPGVYFVVNDNLESDDDSRTLGLIEKKEIYGKVISALRTRDI